ncbi:MAG: VOC family protein [Alphaproteobacteria bacterium]|jgi:catechol 2,3-dioxygenase-like lactoylglutathione lyase family enzyme
MAISHLEHFLVVAHDYEETVDWYIDNLGFTKGPHPDFGADVEVTWLYLGDRDIIHIVPPRKDDPPQESVIRSATPEEIAQGSRPIHHIAFRAENRKEMTARFKDKGITYLEQQASKQDLYQVFVRDPNGITVELNFPAEEAADMEGLAQLALRPEKWKDGKAPAG